MISFLREISLEFTNWRGIFLLYFHRKDLLYFTAIYGQAIVCALSRDLHCMIQLCIMDIEKWIWQWQDYLVDFQAVFFQHMKKYTHLKKTGRSD